MVGVRCDTHIAICKSTAAQGRGVRSDRGQLSAPVLPHPRHPGTEQGWGRDIGHFGCVWSRSDSCHALQSPSQVGQSVTRCVLKFTFFFCPILSQLP